MADRALEPRALLPVGGLGALDDVEAARRDRREEAAEGEQLVLGQVRAVIDHDVPRALLLQLEEVVVVALVRLDDAVLVDAALLDDVRTWLGVGSGLGVGLGMGLGRYGQG